MLAEEIRTLPMVGWEMLRMRIKYNRPRFPQWWVEENTCWHGRMTVYSNTGSCYLSPVKHGVTGLRPHIAAWLWWQVREKCVRFSNYSYLLDWSITRLLQSVCFVVVFENLILKVCFYRHTTSMFAPGGKFELTWVSPYEVDSRWVW